MNTEITEDNVEAVAWILYDGNCRLCCNLKRRIAPLLERHAFRFVPLQDERVRGRLGAHPDATEMRLLAPDGAVMGGADAVAAIARDVWWARPFWAMTKIPGVLPLLRRLYGRLAAHRNCVGGRCAVRSDRGWWPLVLLPLLAFAIRDALPAWAFMWTMTAALFFGFKWLSWREARPGATPRRTAEYFFAYAGMDARNFFAATRNADGAAVGEIRWFFAMVKTAIGIGLIGFAACNGAALGPMASAWLGIVGIILFLHFGLSDLVVFAWRGAGVNATPLMRTPVAATSLNDFWGHRWNTAFSELARTHLFRPLVRRYGTVAAAFGVFLASGLLHELVISVPARGGYGMPTAYFAIQGVAAWLERTVAGRRLGLGRGLCGWLFTAGILVIPLPLLCPEAFLHRVILPMLWAPGVTPCHL